MLDLISIGMQYREQQDTWAHNIKMAERDATLVREQAKEEAESLREYGEKLKGTQRTVVGGSAAKMGEGTPLDIMKETTARIEQDALKIRKEGERIAKGYEEEGKYYQTAAYQSGLATILNLTSTFISKLSPYTFKGLKPSKTIPVTSFSSEHRRKYWSPYISPYGF